MKTRITGIMLLALFLNATVLFAQDVVTVEANNQDISDNLDLEAVASVFADSKNLEDFESRINDYESQISNLDLNEDGYVDYLRVIETTDNNDDHLIVIQSVLGDDLYQDVATIIVEKSENNHACIQIVGDTYLYGENYVIEPVFVATPVFVLSLWTPVYTLWVSPFYWKHYHPRYYEKRAYASTVYVSNVRRYVNSNHVYRYDQPVARYYAAGTHNRVSRNDYGSRYPEKSFSGRHQSVRNRRELVQGRSSHSTARSEAKSGGAVGQQPATHTKSQGSAGNNSRGTGAVRSTSSPRQSSQNSTRSTGPGTKTKSTQSSHQGSATQSSNRQSGQSSPRATTTGSSKQTTTKTSGQGSTNQSTGRQSGQVNTTKTQTKQSAQSSGQRSTTQSSGKQSGGNNTRTTSGGTTTKSSSSKSTTTQPSSSGTQSTKQQTTEREESPR